MINQTLDIDIAEAVKAKLTLYIQADYPETYGNRRRPVVVICPGGAYSYTSVREAEPIALQYLSAGCHAAVLWYDAADEEVIFPQELLELAAAVGYLRKHADEYKIDSDKIIVNGFSAGGHLAASLGCFWQEDWLETIMMKEKGYGKELYKPNGLILAYPVITAGEYSHRGSFDNLLGDKVISGDSVTGLKGAELEHKMSLEYQVTDSCPPVFMWHTFEDGSVPLENSLFFAQALRKAGVSFEYHVFPHGGHGYALGTLETAGEPLKKEVDPQVEQWMPLCKKWLQYGI